MRDEQGRWVSGINESLTVMRHPMTGRWMLLANFHYALSDDPTNFRDSPLRPYLADHNLTHKTMGTVNEIIEWQGKWYRSSMFGPMDHWKLGFAEIAWIPDGAFTLVKPSMMAEKLA